MSNFDEKHLRLVSDSIIEGVKHLLTDSGDLKFHDVELKVEARQHLAKLVVSAIANEFCRRLPYVIDSNDASSFTIGLRKASNFGRF